MHYLKDFLSHQDITKTRIYPHLKCSQQEGLILQLMVCLLLEGSSEVGVLDVLKTCFGEDLGDEADSLDLGADFAGLGRKSGIWQSLQNLQNPSSQNQGSQNQSRQNAQSTQNDAENPKNAKNSENPNAKNQDDENPKDNVNQAKANASDSDAENAINTSANDASINSVNASADNINSASDTKKADKNSAENLTATIATIAKSAKTDKTAKTSKADKTTKPSILAKSMLDKSAAKSRIQTPQTLQESQAPQKSQSPKPNAIAQWLAQEGQKQIALVENITHIKSLLDSGWLALSDFSRMSDMLGRDITTLGLLQMDVCLSPSFHKLLEDGALSLETPSDAPYTDHLEYLTDQFSRISLLSKQSLDTKGAQNAKITAQIKELESRITKRASSTKSEIPAHKIIKEHHLSAKEEVIFFALLKEEYYGDGFYRDMNNLIALISQNEYDKIKNRALLDEKSTLVEKQLVDYGEVLSPFGGIVRTFFIPEEVLRKIIKQPPKKQQNKVSLATALEEQEIFELIQPKTSFEDIILPEQTQAMIESILKQVDSRVIARLKEWGIRDKHKGVEAKILLFGAAGTGKTLSAQGIAKALKKPLLSFDCSKILSMYVGESEKNVRKIFDGYKDIAKKIKNEPVLLLDEADQFLSTRISSSSGAEKMHNQMQNIFLEQIERFNGVLIATTNLVETIDSAFSRRFDYKIEFKRPNAAQRELLWLKYLPQSATYEPKLDIKKLAKELSSFDLSGAQIALVIKNTAYKVATLENPIFKKEDFISAIKREMSGNFDGQKSVGFAFDTLESS